MKLEDELISVKIQLKQLKYKSFEWSLFSGWPTLNNDCEVSNAIVMSE